jgi:hypothetical protein
MKTILLLFITLVLLFGCASEKSELYDKAIDYVKEHLKAPSSANFNSYGNTSIQIIENAGVGNPFREFLNDNDTSSFYAQYDSTRYSTALVTLTYEAQNSFGVYLKNNCKVYLTKWNFEDGSGEWKAIQIIEGS